MSDNTDPRSAAVAGARAAGTLPAVRPVLLRSETAALGVLIAGAGLGLVLWAKWGFLVALQALTTVCF